MDDKKCCKCKEYKELCNFHKNKNTKDGYSDVCKQCSKEYQLKYRELNREKHKAYCKNYAIEHKEELIEMRKEYYQENKEKCLSYRKEYRESNKELVAESKKKYYEANKAEINARKQEKETVESRQAKRQYNRNYYTENKQKFIAANAKRKAVKIKATPEWLTDEQLQEIEDYYTVSLLFRIYSGVEHHVDHIVPLQGELVSGLHVPWNLQVLTAKDNIKKRNNFDIEG